MPRIESKILIELILGSNKRIIAYILKYIPFSLARSLFILRTNFILAAEKKST